MTKTFISILTLFISLPVSLLAQANMNKVEQSLHSAGKMPVVITVLSIIFACIVIYLIVLDRKLGKLEKMLKDKQNK